MRLTILLTLSAVSVGAAGASAAETCCYANFRFSGPCVVTLAPGETCSSVLAYLNDLSSSGKTYCGSTPIRRGWSHTTCPGEVASGDAVPVRPVPVQPGPGARPVATGGDALVVSPEQTRPWSAVGPQAAPIQQAPAAVDLRDLTISVRLDDSVDPGSVTTHDEFTGRLATDLVTPDGSVIAPAGSLAFARAVPTDDGVMRLEVTDVVSGDEVLPVASSPFTVPDSLPAGEMLEVRVSQIDEVPPGLLELRRSVESWIDAFGRGDADALASLFTEDSMLFPTGAAPVDGRAAIRDYFEQRFAHRKGTIELEQVEVGVEGGLGYKRGRWRELSKDGEVASSGSFLEVWKRVGDRWLLHRGMWTPDAT